VQSIEYFAGEPATYEYRLRTPQNETIVLTLDDLGYSLPVEVGQSYTFNVQSVGGVPAANGIRISDASGLRFMAVTDWRPNFSVFTEGYGAWVTPALCRSSSSPTGAIHASMIRGAFSRSATTVWSSWPGAARQAMEPAGSEAGGLAHPRVEDRRRKGEVGLPEELQQQISFFVERDGIRTRDTLRRRFVPNRRLLSVQDQFLRRRQPKFRPRRGPARLPPGAARSDPLLQ